MKKFILILILLLFIFLVILKIFLVIKQLKKGNKDCDFSTLIVNIKIKKGLKNKP